MEQDLVSEILDWIIQFSNSLLCSTFLIFLMFVIYH